MGGRPSKGTKADRRLKANKGSSGKAAGTRGAVPAVSKPTAGKKSGKR